MNIDSPSSAEYCWGVNVCERERVCERDRMGLMVGWGGRAVISMMVIMMMIMIMVMIMIVLVIGVPDGKARPDGCDARAGSHDERGDGGGEMERC